MSRNKITDLNLPTIFEKLIAYREDLENSALNISSNEIQDKVAESVELCHRGIEMINKLSVFSDNEYIDEVTTNELKYLLLPAFLGYFTNKNTIEDRFEVVKKCRECFVNFIKLCKVYKLTSYKIDSNLNNEGKDVASSVHKSVTPVEQMKEDSARRQEKIERFKSVKNLDKELEELYKEVKKEHVDEEIKREYYLKLINKWIYESIDSLESLDSEIPLLEHMKKLKSSKNESNDKPIEPCNGHECSKHSNKKFQPFIITKDTLQKQVFGLGYPGIPTVSVDEFYDQKVREGLFPSAASSSAKKIQPDEEAEEKKREKEAEEKDKNEDEDDADALNKARRWDEYRDDHRRGWGNMHNKG